MSPACPPDILASAYGGLFLREQGRAFSRGGFPSDTAYHETQSRIKLNDGYKGVNSNSGLHPCSSFYSLVMTINVCSRYYPMASRGHSPLRAYDHCSREESPLRSGVICPALCPGQMLANLTELATHILGGACWGTKGSQQTPKHTARADRSHRVQPEQAGHMVREGPPEALATQSGPPREMGRARAVLIRVLRGQPPCTSPAP